MGNKGRMNEAHVINVKLLITLLALVVFLSACGQKEADTPYTDDVESKNSSSGDSSGSSEKVVALTEQLDSATEDQYMKDGEEIFYPSADTAINDLRETTKYYNGSEADIATAIEEAQKDQQKAIEVAKSYKERGIKLDSLDRRCNPVKPAGLAEPLDMRDFLSRKYLEAADRHEKLLKEALDEASELSVPEKESIADDLKYAKETLKELRDAQSTVLKASDKYETTYKYSLLEIKRLEKVREATSKSVNCWL